MRNRCKIRWDIGGYMVEEGRGLGLCSYPTLENSMFTLGLSGLG